VPSVDSAFVVIEKCGGKTLPPRFDVFIKSVFSARRKKIRNTVNPAILLKCGINPELRPEQVSTEDFVKICLEIPKNDIIM
jgi:16S rRNA A1518/A1519 N6-dimethyltransferase RsmA/KsgA/DIM1 with predicted DNA glycosylase/AP lyase activity